MEFGIMVSIGIDAQFDGSSFWVQLAFFGDKKGSAVG